MKTRRPAVAGTFYPEGPDELVEVVDGCLAQARTGGGVLPKALIVPHAGFVYSGPIAGSAYATLASAAADIERVVLLGPSHRVPLRGLAVPEARSFEGPLGAIEVDAAGVAAIRELPQVQVSDLPHAHEHSLEVQLPFLQRVLGSFRLVPVVVGDASPEEVGEVIDALWGGSETLVVVSSDLSHYLDYETARHLDARTTRAIEELRWDAVGDDQACGRVPVRGLLLVAKRRGLSVETLDVRSSGDTAGRRDQVVGYGAWAFH